MKNFLLLLIFFLLSLSGIGQSKNKLSLKSSFGLYFLGSGDIFMPKLEIETRYSFNKIISVGLSANMGYRNSELISFSSRTNRPFINSSTMHIDEYLYLTYFLWKDYSLIFGTGPSLMFISDQGALMIFDEEERKLIRGEYKRRFSVGWQFAPEMNIPINKKGSLINIKVMTQIYKNADISSGISVGMIQCL